MHVDGPAAIELIENPSPDEYRIKMTAEGIYYFTATVTGPDGNTYQNTVAITVMNRDQLDRILKTKWEGMKTALINQDINGTLTYFIEETKPHYNALFTAFQSHLSEVVLEIQDIQMARVRNKSATYRMRRSELYGGQVVLIDYAIYFIVDNNGLWKIDWF